LRVNMEEVPFLLKSNGNDIQIKRLFYRILKLRKKLV